jgi:hypothetical protein
LRWLVKYPSLCQVGGLNEKACGFFSPEPFW